MAPVSSPLPVEHLSEMVPLHSLRKLLLVGTPSAEASSLVEEVQARVTPFVRAPQRLQVYASK